MYIFYACVVIGAVFLFKTWFQKENQFSEQSKEELKLIKGKDLDIKEPKSMVDSLKNIGKKAKGGGDSGPAK